MEQLLALGGFIVMGAKRRNSLARHAPHTTALEVVSKAPWPVLTVRS
jgi:hypothetical protein